MSNTHRSRLLAQQRIAEDTGLFRFEKPAGYAFRAGQAIDLRLPALDEGVDGGAVRTFSLVSAPGDGELAVATRLRDTPFKRALAALAPGAAVELGDADGDFALAPDDARPVVLLAGGIGITPFMSMLRDGASRGRELHLVYSNRRARSAAFLDELEALQRTRPGFRLTATLTDTDAITPAWRGARGQIDRALLEDRIGVLPGRVFYVAGPPTMVEAMCALLAATGVAAADVHADEFFGY